MVFFRNMDCFTSKKHGDGSFASLEPTLLHLSHYDEHLSPFLHRMNHNLLWGVIYMPAIVGAIKVNAVASSGVFNVGDVFRIAPVSTAKTFSGAGSFNTGDNLRVRNDYSVTNVNDSDVADQNITGVV